jgi:hypothetical protein
LSGRARTDLRGVASEDVSLAADLEDLRKVRQSQKDLLDAVHEQRSGAILEGLFPQVVADRLMADQWFDLLRVDHQFVNGDTSFVSRLAAGFASLLFHESQIGGVGCPAVLREIAGIVGAQ